MFAFKTKYGYRDFDCISSPFYGINPPGHALPPDYVASRRWLKRQQTQACGPLDEPNQTYTVNQFNTTEAVVSEDISPCDPDCHFETPPGTTILCGATEYSFTNSCNSGSYLLLNEYTDDHVISDLDALLAAGDYPAYGNYVNPTYNSDGSGSVIVGAAAAGVVVPSVLGTPQIVAFFSNDAQTSIEFAKMRSKVRLTWTIPAYCTGDGDYRLTVWLMTVPNMYQENTAGIIGGGDPEPTFEDRSIDYTPIEDDTTIVMEFEVGVPADVNTGIFVTGAANKALAIVQGQTQGAFSFKAGFQEYANQSTPPKFYKTETASGSFPGCEAAGIASKNYSGTNQVIATTPPPVAGSVVFNDPCGANTNTFSPDVAFGSPIYPNALSMIPQWTTESTTSRTLIIKSTCGTEPIEDSLTMELSDELTLEEIQTAVDAVVSADWADPVSGLVPEPWFLLGKRNVCAAQLLATNETFYANQKARFKITGSLPNTFFEDKSFDFAYSIYSRDLATGEISHDDLTVSIDFPAGSSSKDSDWIELTPELGIKKWLVVDPAAQPAHALFFDNAPNACLASSPTQVVDPEDTGGL